MVAILQVIGVCASLLALTKLMADVHCPSIVPGQALLIVLPIDPDVQFSLVLRLQRALIVRLVLRVNWW